MPLVGGAGVQGSFCTLDELQELVHNLDDESISLAQVCNISYAGQAPALPVTNR